MLIYISVYIYIYVCVSEFICTYFICKLFFSPFVLCSFSSPSSLCQWQLNVYLYMPLLHDALQIVF